MTLSLKGLYVKQSINDTQHNNALPLCWVSCLIVMLSVFMLSVIMVNVVVPLM